MRELLPLLVSTVTFTGLLLSGTMFYWGIRARQEDTRRTLELRMSGPREDALLQRRSAGENSAGLLGALDTLLLRAGATATTRGLVLGCLLLSVVGLLVLLWLLRSPLAVLGLLIGGVPLMVLRERARSRARALTLQLPDALDLVNRTLRAGHALSDSLRITAVELPAPIGEELGQVAEETRLGRSMRQSLRDLTQRYPSSFDLRLLASAILLHQDTGGHLVEMLEHLAETIRSRTLFEDKVEALTAEVRFSAAVLAGLPLVLGVLIYVIQPGYFEPMLTTELGRYLSLAGIGMLVSGALIMRQLSAVEV